MIRKQTAFFIWMAFLLILALLVAAAGETLLRARGRKPFRPMTAWDLRIEPGGYLYQRDDTLGFTHRPGPYQVTFSNGYTFRVTNNDAGHRITQAAPAAAAQPEIWIFGCSFAYGWGLNDRDTFPWRIQEQFPQCSVINFGQCGYATVQSLLQFRQAIQQGESPAIVVLTYAGFHDMRNACLDVWRKGFAYFRALGPIAQPYARLDNNGNLAFHMTPEGFTPWPLARHSALIYSLEEKWDLLAERRWIHSHAISEALISQFAAECRNRNIPFVVAGMALDDTTRAMQAYVAQNEIAFVNAAVDHTNDNRYNLLPYDNHPNAEANRMYASRIGAYLAAQPISPK